MPTIKGKQVITNVYMDVNAYEALKELSAKTGAPMAFYFRKGIDWVLEQHGVKVKPAPKSPTKRK